jgi:ABC-2 type transport system ATP-binding protein
MDEGERCQRVAILDAGRLVALDTPAALRREVGGSLVTVRGEQPEALAQEIRARFQVDATVLDGTVRIPHPEGATLVPRLAAAFPERMASVTVQSPTLEDVFVQRTGHGLVDASASAAAAS